MPSFASSDWNSCCCSSRSSVSPDSNGTSAPDWTDRLISPTALDALWGGVNCLAYSITWSQKSSAANTSLTSPSSFALSKEKVSPFTIISMARGLPTMRARRCVPPVPGSTPRFTSGRPILPAFSLARRMSHAMAISSPPPTVCPLRAAIVSLGVCSSRLRVSFACRQKKYLNRGVVPVIDPIHHAEQHVAGGAALHRRLLRGHVLEQSLEQVHVPPLDRVDLSLPLAGEGIRFVRQHFHLRHVGGEERHVVTDERVQALPRVGVAPPQRGERALRARQDPHEAALLDPAEQHFLRAPVG